MKAFFEKHKAEIIDTVKNALCGYGIVFAAALLILFGSLLMDYSHADVSPLCKLLDELIWVIGVYVIGKSVRNKVKNEQRE